MGLKEDLDKVMKIPVTRKRGEFKTAFIDKDCASYRKQIAQEIKDWFEQPCPHAAKDMDRICTQYARHCCDTCWQAFWRERGIE